MEIGVRSGVGAGGGLGCGPLEGLLRNIGRRRRMAKGMRKAHIVVGSHEANNDNNINRQTVVLRNPSLTTSSWDR